MSVEVPKFHMKFFFIVKTQRNSANALELDIVATCSPPPPHPTQTIQPLLDQLESCNLAQTLIALGFDN